MLKGQRYIFKKFVNVPKTPWQVLSLEKEIQVKDIRDKGSEKSLY